MADSGKKRKLDKHREDSKAKDGKKDPAGDDDSCRYNLISALNHKMRRQMLRRLDRSEDPLSPAKLSQQMDVPLTNASYHMDVLRKCGASVVVDEQRVRGAVEHFHESKVTDHPGVQAMLEETEAEDEDQTSF
jgi:DNA-binding transcriptional ArsR family regulator